MFYIVQCRHWIWDPNPSPCTLKTVVTFWESHRGIVTDFHEWRRQFQVLFTRCTLGKKWSQQNLICRKYISVYSLNTIESIMQGDVTDFQELIGGETTCSQSSLPTSGQNMLGEKLVQCSVVLEKINDKLTASQNDRNWTVRMSGRVRKVSKKLLESFESGEFTKSNKVDENMEVDQAEENKENEKNAQNADVTQRVRRDLKVLRRLEKSVEQLRKHIERIGERGTLQRCQMLLICTEMLSLSEKTWKRWFICACMLVLIYVQVYNLYNGSFPPTETDSDPWDGDPYLKWVQ